MVGLDWFCSDWNCFGIIWKLEKWFLTNYIKVLSKNMKRGKISKHWDILALIFIKYFHKRNRERWNEQKRAYDEKVMLKTS